MPRTSPSTYPITTRRNTTMPYATRFGVPGQASSDTMRARMRFNEFWSLYLSAHRRPGTRAAHYFATILGAATTLVSIHQSQVLYMIGGIAAAYMVAIASHRW